MSHKKQAAIARKAIGRIIIEFGPHNDKKEYRQAILDLGKIDDYLIQIERMREP